MEERSDFVEVELKIRPEGRYSRIVEIAQESAPEGWMMIRKPHVAFFDLYFDTKGMELTSFGVHLRVRFGVKSFRDKGRYKLFFKEHDPREAGAPYLSRREVRTDLRRRELLRYQDGSLPGLAAELAYSRIGGSERQPLFPVCLISTFRRYFTMRHPTVPGTDYLNLGIEQSTAFAARGIDIPGLIETGFIDGPDVGRGYDFELSEAEMTIEDEPVADAMFERLTAGLTAEFEVVTVPKYEQCLAALGINESNLV